ncbi:IclR family transcriptional regulator [Mesorhizobium sp. M1403]|uniref:IclR family transcriptional regulator n=1 Tax=Mesorhizobium sp. M1403 TaxID=2957097 RepID=UPI00333C74C7
MSGAVNLERGLTLLEILAEAPEGLSLGEISELARLPKSASHRVLSSLTACGFATQVKNRNYRLTMKMAALGFRTLGDSGGLEHCQALLNKVAGEFEELVGMTLVDNGRLVWIAKAQGARGSLVVAPGMGRDVALHATATGKVWLSSLPTDDAVAVVLRDGFGTPQEHGPNVLQSVESLLRELHTTKQRGYGFVWEEAEPGIAAVAVGIPAAIEQETPLLGTISVAGPIARVTRDRLLAFVPALRKTSLKLLEAGTVLRLWRRDATRPPRTVLNNICFEQQENPK